MSYCSNLLSDSLQKHPIQGSLVLNSINVSCFFFKLSCPERKAQLELSPMAMSDSSPSSKHIGITMPLSPLHYSHIFWRARRYEWACIQASSYPQVCTCIKSVPSFTAPSFSCCTPLLPSLYPLCWCNSSGFLTTFRLPSLPAIQRSSAPQRQNCLSWFSGKENMRSLFYFLEQMHSDLILYCEYSTSAQIFPWWLQLARHKMPTVHQTSPALALFTFTTCPVFTSIESFGFVQLTSKCSYYRTFDNAGAVSWVCLPGAESKLAMMEYQFEAEAFP